uniref:Peptidase metallopeptidase domain-containing protein n=1 Tax=Strigamia maritima TaxID=126957 RepID=T1J720_STRMM
MAPWWLGARLRPPGSLAVALRASFSTQMGFLLLLVAAAWCLRSLDARPVVYHMSSHQQLDSATMAGAVDFLTKYGYLPPTDLNAGNLRTEEQLKDAIRAMQRYAGISETGVVDERTINIMSRRRCGVPDVVGTSDRVRRYALQGGKWDHLDLTWSIVDSAATLDYRTIRHELSRAFKVWSEASRLTFTELARGQEADISISFFRGYHGDGYSFDGPGSVLAHAFFPGPGLGGDTHFDDEEAWDATHNQDSTGVSLFAVAAHEFGHSLGLSHSRDQTALMYPYYQWIQAEFVLPEDDRMGIQQLYGSSRKEWATLPPIYTRPPHVPTERPQPATRHPPTSGYYPQPSAASPKGDIPNTCETSYDAVSMIRGELFIFKGKYFWRLDDRGVQPGYPAEIKRFWYHLPNDIKRIDAVYERPRDKKIIIFIGKQYWLFNANIPEPGYPKPLTHLGLPANLNKIDAAMVWGHNGKTYFFSGRQYWRFDESDMAVELDYPRDMNMWKKVPYNIDAAFQWTDKNTYFFRKKHYWKFDDVNMIVENEKGSLSAPFWMKCPKDKLLTKAYVDVPYVEGGSTVPSCTHLLILFASILSLLLTR